MHKYMVKRSKIYEEIRPLIDLCKRGDLFAVQEWIAAGKPVNPPLKESGNRLKSPLEIAIDLGFHSMVKILLEGGADINEPRSSRQARRLRRARPYPNNEKAALFSSTADQ
jgi:hypothetical protein